MAQHTKQRAVELAIKDATRNITATIDGDYGEWTQEIGIDDRDIERIAMAAIEAMEKWQMKHDKHYTQPVADLQEAVDLVRTHGGLMITRTAVGGINYGTPQGDVFHARVAKEMIQRGMVVPDGADLLGDTSAPQLYRAAIR